MGNEDTFKEMMRVRRTVESKYSVLPPTLEKVEMKIEQENNQKAKIDNVSSKYDTDIGVQNNSSIVDE